MIISHNMLALNAQRQYNMTTTRKSSHSEKLASGYRINRASDDAAGLKISEKMRSQVRGLNRAATNIMEGVDLLQVTDGGLNEAEAIIQRVRELSVQAANDTNAQIDRDAIQQEINESIKEFDRIAETTTYNGIKPLRSRGTYTIGTGGTGGVTVTPTPIADNGYLLDKKDIPYVNMDSGQPGTTTGFEMDFAGADKTQFVGKSFFVTCSQNCTQTFEFMFKNGGGSSATLDGNTGSASIKVEIDINDVTSGTDIPGKIGQLLSASPVKDVFNTHGTNDNYVIGHANRMYIDGSRMVFYPTNGTSGYAQTNYSKEIQTGAGNVTINNLRMGSIYMGDVAELVQISQDTTVTAAQKGLKIQSGAQSNEFIEIPLTWMEAKEIGFDPLDVDSYEHAGESIQKADIALGWVNDRRAEYGALQNRLEHAYEVDRYSAQNTDSAESRIRDTDMANEMVEFSKENILASVGESMMAQANSLPEQVLRLLQ